jgi:hypothetical protein
MLTAPWTGEAQRRGIVPYDTLQESLCFPDPELDTRHREFAEEEARKREALDAAAINPASEGGAR